jgi:hypothetical protein
MQGTRFDLYAPGHYAAIAAWKQGSCGRALQYLEDGQTRAIAGQVPALAAEQQQVRSACGGAAVAAEPARPPPTPAPTATPPVSAPKPAPPAVAEPTPDARPPVVAEAPKPAPAAPVVAPPATKSAPPAALRTAVRAFLAGDYATVQRTGDAGIADARARALLLMVRAAAGYAQADLRGDAAAASRADADVRRARQLARIEPDPYLFSPKMRARFAAVR